MMGLIRENSFHKMQLRELYEAINRCENKIFTKLIAMRNFKKANIEDIKNALGSG